MQIPVDSGAVAFGRFDAGQTRQRVSFRAEAHPVVQAPPAAGGGEAADGAEASYHDLKHEAKDISKFVKSFVKDLLKSSDLDKETRKEAKQLSKDFGRALKDIVKSHKDGETIDAQAVASDIETAFVSLAKGLQEALVTAPPAESNARSGSAVDIQKLRSGFEGQLNDLLAALGAAPDTPSAQAAEPGAHTIDVTA